jgi:hypothetical protein
LCSSGAEETTQECLLRQAVTKKDDDTKKTFHTKTCSARLSRNEYGNATGMAGELLLLSAQLVKFPFMYFSAILNQMSDALP